MAAEAEAEAVAVEAVVEAAAEAVAVEAVISAASAAIAEAEEEMKKTDGAHCAKRKAERDVWKAEFLHKELSKKKRMLAVEEERLFASSGAVHLRTRNASTLLQQLAELRSAERDEENDFTVEIGAFAEAHSVAVRAIGKHYVPRPTWSTMQVDLTIDWECGHVDTPDWRQCTVNLKYRFSDEITCLEVGIRLMGPGGRGKSTTFKTDSSVPLSLQAMWRALAGVAFNTDERRFVEHLVLGIPRDLTPSDLAKLQERFWHSVRIAPGYRIHA